MIIGMIEERTERLRSYTYNCPHCGAQDSTRCSVLPASDPARPYTEAMLERARAVGCRVVHYVDRRNS